MKLQPFWKWPSGLVAAVLLVTTASQQVALSQPTNTPPGLGAETNTNAVAPATASQPGPGDQLSEDFDLADAAVQPISTAKPLPPSITPTGALAEVIRLVNAGVEESVLMAYVTNSTNLFNLGVEEIIYLNDIGVPGEVITAMIQHDQALKELGVTASEAPEAAPPESQPEPSQMAPQFAPQQEYTTSDYVPPPTTDIGYSTFYDSLAPYGAWINVSGYGPCWQPTAVIINPTWQPYCDGGRWIYTDCGWYWLSGYSWGWAPFHYGRWFRHRRYGWCWAPGTVWGPAWVCWRYNNAYCGWAPLPPGAWYRPGIGFTFHGRAVHGSFGFGLGLNCFTFVGVNHFRDPYLHHYALPHQRAAEVYRGTAPTATVTGSHHRVTNHGIPASRVAAATRGGVRRISLRTTTDSSSSGSRAERWEGNRRTLSVYRPQFTQSHESRPAPAGRSRVELHNAAGGQATAPAAHGGRPASSPRRAGRSTSTQGSTVLYIGGHREQAPARVNAPAATISGSRPTATRGGTTSSWRSAPASGHRPGPSGSGAGQSSPRSANHPTRSGLPMVSSGNVANQRPTANRFSTPTPRTTRSWAPPARQETSRRPMVNQRPQSVRNPTYSGRTSAGSFWSSPRTGGSTARSSRTHQFVVPSVRAPSQTPRSAPASVRTPQPRRSFSSPRRSSLPHAGPAVSQPSHSARSTPASSSGGGYSHSSSNRRGR